MTANFKQELTQVVRDVILKEKKDGTTEMSADCLWGIVANRIPRQCPSAPKGINCAWVARQTFNEVVADPKFKSFLL